LLVSSQQGDAAIETLKDRLGIDHSVTDNGDAPAMVG